jgi:NAD(P)-dependent dehydrogenase (short-subunit alcohol dehydrogenase family)
MDIANQIAVVTGGASGIGRSIALALGAAGASGVVVADIDAAGAAKVAAEIETAGHRAVAVPTDMTSESAVQALVAAAEAAFGPVDLFFSNAGIIVGGGVEVADDAWSRIWAINVHSHVYAARALLPGMLDRGRGHRVGCRPAHPARLGTVCGHQACGRRAGRVAVGYVRGPGPGGVGAVPAGSYVQPADDQPARARGGGAARGRGQPGLGPGGGRRRARS